MSRAGATILITRSEPEASRTAQRVQSMGLEPLVLPLTQTEPVQEGLASLADTHGERVGHAIATSARAVDVLEGHGFADWIRRQTWATVGQRTAAALQRLDAPLLFDPMASSTELVVRLSPKFGQLVYPCAADRRPDLERAVSGIEPIVVYQAQASGGFSADQAAALHENPPAYALIYSPRSAKLLRDALVLADPDQRLKAMGWLCLSPEVAQQAPEGAPIWSAVEPNEAALLSLLKDVAS